MSNDTVWIRIPRHIYNETRQILTDAADDLEHAKQRNPADPIYGQTSARARLINAELNRTARGLLINETDAA
jgi:hypothetical protein